MSSLEPDRRRCCCSCGCDPRHGSLAAGCCHLVIGFVASIAIFEACTSLEEDEDSSEEETDGNNIVLTAAGLEALTRILMSLLLIYAVYKEKKSLLQLWVVVNEICVLVTFLWMALFMVMAASLGEEWLIGFGVSGADASLRTYFVLVVRSYRKLLAECSTGATVRPSLSVLPPEIARGRYRTRGDKVEEVLSTVTITN